MACGTATVWRSSLLGLLAPFLTFAGGGFEEARQRMIADDIAGRGISHPAVLQAMAAVPRERFVPAPERARAYGDHPIPIGHDQTISQPYIVALMSELAAPEPGERVLEIGTGSGYQAAILAAMGAEVYSIEIIPELAARAREVLAQLAYPNVHLRTGDGYAGWPEHAPFAAIVLTAAPPEIPAPLIAQLAPGGRLVAPIGDDAQQLVVLTKAPDGTLTRRNAAAVRFVPMTGQAQHKAGE